MEISCAFPPGPAAVDHIVEAERLGYERAWLFDSPALYGDIWVIAALAAKRTARISLGPAVLVPNLRHPLAQPVATLRQRADERERRREHVLGIGAEQLGHHRSDAFGVVGDDAD